MGRASQYESPQEFTPRERDVRELLRLGLTDVEIAQRLSISKSGVGHHVSAIMAKLHVANRYEAAYWPERPPWFAHGAALAGMLWKRGGPVLSGTKASSAALALSGGAFLATLGVLALIAALLVRAGGDAPAISPASAFMETRPSNEQRDLVPPEPPALVTPSPNEPEPQAATPTPTSRPVPAVSLSSVGEAFVIEVPKTPLPPVQSPSTPVPMPMRTPTPAPTPTPTPTLESTPLPPQPGVMAVDCDASEPGVQKDCSYEADALFRLQIHITRAPTYGYTLFEIKLRWGDAGLAYLPTTEPVEEGIWTSCDEQKRYGITAKTLHFGCIPVPFPETAGMETGAVLEFQFRCGGNGTIPIGLPQDKNNPQFATRFMDGHLFPLGTVTEDARVTCGP